MLLFQIIVSTMAARNKYNFEELMLLFEVHVLYPGYRSVKFWQFVQNNLIPAHPWISIRDKYRRLVSRFIQMERWLIFDQTC